MLIGLDLIGIGLLLTMVFAVAICVGDELNLQRLVDTAKLGFLVSLILIVIGAATFLCLLMLNGRI